MKVYSNRLQGQAKQDKEKEVISFPFVNRSKVSAPNVWDLMMIETSGEDPSSFSSDYE